MSPAGGMSPIVQTVSRWVRGLLLVFGLHMVLHGHLGPGGGFSGGVVIAAAFALVMLAEGHRSAAYRRVHAVADAAYAVPALAFLGIAVAGVWVSGVFFDNFITTPPSHWFALDSSGTILISNVAVGLLVGAGLVLCVAALARSREFDRADASREEEAE